MTSAMKLGFVTALFAAASLQSMNVSAATADELMAQAKSAYAAREYDATGVKSAKEAVELYKQASKAATDKTVRYAALVGESEALHFVGAASNDTQVKIDTHLAGIERADEVVKAYGISNVEAVADADLAKLKALPAAELALLGEALYFRGINLGQWGSANGVMASLNRWPELRSNMEVIVNLGIQNIHEYGPYRVLGRGYFKVPGLFGGSNQKAEKYLSAAVKYTLAAGKKISTNGNNNTYYAELLKDLGRDAEAVALMKELVAADPVTVSGGNGLPEFKQAQKDAAELLKSW